MCTRRASSCLTPAALPTTVRMACRLGLALTAFRPSVVSECRLPGGSISVLFLAAAFRQHMSQKAGKTLKQERAEKQAR